MKFPNHTFEKKSLSSLTWPTRLAWLVPAFNTNSLDLGVGREKPRMGMSEALVFVRQTLDILSKISHPTPQARRTINSVTILPEDLEKREGHSKGTWGGRGTGRERKTQHSKLL